MVTIKQALTNKYGAATCRTILSLSTGEAFKWDLTDTRNSGRAPEWCVKLEVYHPGMRLQRMTHCRLDNGLVGQQWENVYVAFTYIEGPLAGRIFYDEGKAKVVQP